MALNINHPDAELAKVRGRCSALPLIDTRTADEIVGYDERGLPR